MKNAAIKVRSGLHKDPNFQLRHSPTLLHIPFLKQDKSANLMLGVLLKGPHLVEPLHRGRRAAYVKTVQDQVALPGNSQNLSERHDPSSNYKKVFLNQLRLVLP